MKAWILGLLLCSAGAAHAQMADSPSAAADHQAMAHMHDAMMAAPVTGDADRDFVAGMVPHHQGAIDMAKIELRYGTDPVLRQLAQRIIAAQQSEIALMRRWQADHAQADHGQAEHAR